MTFCDLQEPLILTSFLGDESIFKKLIYPHIKDKNSWYLQFNNSTIFESNRTGKFTELFWELGMDNFKLFFTKLYSLKCKSLNHKKNILYLREKLQNNILALRPKLDYGLMLKEIIKQENKIIKIISDLINKIRNFRIKTKNHTISKESLLPGGFSISCLNCNFTCHNNNNCKCSNNDNIKNCCLMINGNCTVCAKKCK